jgi:hypothetical protein
MGEKRTIEIGYFDGLGLIMLDPSGVYYTSQVGGYACLHPEAEGVFFPLPTDLNRYELNTLRQHFNGSWEALNDYEADLVDTVLRRSSRNLNWISVDRSRLKDSFEAWVYVKLNPKKTKMDDLVKGFDDSFGILVWPNSD